MNRLLRFLALMLVVVFALSGCALRRGNAGVDDKDDVESIPVTAEVPLTNNPTPTPTHVPEVTITPRPVSIPLETLDPQATLISIEPIDKPKRTFKFTPYSNQTLGLEFNVPDGWRVVAHQDDSSVEFVEPESNALDGFAARLWIRVLNQSSNLVREDAVERIEAARNNLREEFPDIEISARADNNRMLGEYGYYYNYRIPMASGYPVRGRIYAVAVSRMIIQVELRCPARYNEDYMEIFREVRNSAKVYGAE